MPGVIVHHNGDLRPAPFLLEYVDYNRQFTSDIEPRHERRMLGRLYSVRIIFAKREALVDALQELNLLLDLPINAEICNHENQRMLLIF